MSVEVKGRHVAVPVRNRKVPWQPIAVFVLLALALLTLTNFFLARQKKHARSYAESELATIADLKALQVSSWRNIRLGLGDTLFENRFFGARIQKVIQGPDTEQARQEIVAELASLKKSLPYETAAVLLPGGKIVLTQPNTPSYGPAPEAVRLCLEAWQARKVQLGDLYKTRESGRLQITLAIPILIMKEGSPQPIALLVFDYSPNPSLYPILQAWPMPSQTSETLLLARDGADFVQLSEPHDRMGTALSYRFPVRAFRHPGKDTSLGEEGLVEGKDYRGSTVLGYIKAVPNSPWFLMTKTDVAEIRAGHGLGYGGPLTAGILVLIVAAGLTLVLFWRREGAAFEAQEQDRWEKAVKNQDDFLSVMISVMPNAAFFKDTRGVLVGCNAAFEKLLNLSRDKILGKTFRDLVEEKLADKDKETDEALLQKSGVQVYEAGLKAWDGGVHDIIFIKSSYAKPNGMIGGLIVTLIDLTQRKRIEEELQQIKTFTDGIVQTMTEGLVLTDAEGKFTFVNPAGAALLGYRPADMVDREVVSFVPKDQRNIVKEADDRRSKGISDRYELDFLHKDGSRRTLLVSGGPRVSGSGASGTMAVLLDITDRKLMEEQIRSLSLEDELTKLYNRRGFMTLAEQQLKNASRLHKRAFLIYADVDNLKAVNDTFGHKEGDKALVQLAAAIKKSFRESDIVARLGGDEFVVLAMETTRSGADILTKRLDEKLAMFNLHMSQEGNASYTVSVSLGVAMFDPEFPSRIEDMIVQADSHMYEQKKAKKIAS